MSESARERPPAEAAAEAVKAYVRFNREALAADGELLAQLLPERFQPGDVRDLQRFVIDRLRAENMKLRAERDALKAQSSAVAQLWRARADRYSVLRTAHTTAATAQPLRRVEMSYIGG